MALVSLAQRVPWLVFGPLGGAWADRVNRRWLMNGLDGFRALVMVGLGVLVVARTLSLPLLVVVFLAMGAAEAVFDSAAGAFLPALVPAAGLAAANGRLQSALQLARGLVGPPVGGALFLVAAAVPFLGDGVSFAVAVLLVVLIPARHGAAPARPGGRRPLWTDVVDGLRWLWADTYLRRLALGSAVVHLAWGAVSAVLVLYAARELGVGNAGYGLLLAVASLGGITAGVLAGRVARVAGTARALRLAAVTNAASYLVLAVVRTPVAAGAALALEGASAVLWIVTVTSARQRLAPAHLTGRVTGSYLTLQLVGASVGALLGGVVGQAVGLPAVVVGAGAAVAVMCLVLWRGLGSGEAGQVGAWHVLGGDRADQVGVRHHVDTEAVEE